MIVDSKNGRVIEVDPKGNIIWSFGELVLPYDADALPDGGVLISDSGRSRVIIVDRSGDILWEFRISS